MPLRQLSQPARRKNQMNKYLLMIFTILLMGSISSPIQAKAQDSTSSGQTTESLKKRIEKLVEEKREQIKGVLSDINIQKRGFIGEVQRVSEDTVTVKTNKGTHIIALEGVALLKSGKSIRVEEIAVGDWVVVLGFIENDNFQAKRILVSSTSLRPPPQVVEIGTITAMDNNSITIETRKDQEIITISTSKTTEYLDLQGEAIKRLVIKPEMQALIIGLDDKGKKNAVKVRILTATSNEN